MRRNFIPLLATLFVVGCSTTPADLEKSSTSRAVTKNFSENYQEIYRRIYGPATRCGAGTINPYASLAVDAQLYTELGFGEITNSMINVGVRNYYWKAKIERVGSGSRLSVTAGNTLGREQILRNVLRWASGDDKC